MKPAGAYHAQFHWNEGEGRLTYTGSRLEADYVRTPLPGALSHIPSHTMDCHVPRATGLSGLAGGTPARSDYL